MTTKLLLTTSLMAALATGAAQAQSTAFEPENAAAEAVSDLRTDIREDADRDIRTSSGNLGRPIGFDGSVALRATASRGNTDAADLGIGANLGWYDGQNGLGLSLSYSYGETEGTQTEGSLLYGLDYTRDITRDFFVFGQVQGAQDDFGAFTRDTYVGVGAGYRLINRASQHWAVAGGVGYRWLEDAAGTETDEEALSLSSNYSQRFGNAGARLSMDTDVIMSEADTVVYNDLGVSFALNSNLALRTSVVTEYHTDPLPGRDDTDHTFGVSLVYNFN